MGWFTGGSFDQHALYAAGPQAHAIEHLFWFYVALLSVVVVSVLCSVALAIIKRRTRSSGLTTPALAAEEMPEREPMRQIAPLDAGREKRGRARIILSTVLTAIALIVLLAESISTSNALEALSGGQHIEIQVTGRQWWWQVRYLDPEPTRVFNTANELHLPLGHSVRLRLSAADVIHSFWAPNLQGKRDLIPGHDNDLVLRVDRPGRYRMQCAEFCGGAHAQMAMWIVAEPRADYEAWCTQQRQSAREPVTELQREGRAVFLRAQCPTCHTISGTSAQANWAPDLTHAGSRIGIGAASFPNRRGFLAGWLLGAPAMKPAVHMPRLTLPARDLQALVAYLESLQ
ncbi:MAG TPA: cytochrome c oxidase subunit II [Polyangiales bacterium]|nr:cytochrome c oxidase subunit II [Polyangiales bacterium]